MKNKEKLRELLVRISHGTHDPMPTRMLPYPDSKAMQVDEWWQNYFISARDSYRVMAHDAIKLLDENA
jgi:hypothetical protein